MKYCTMLMMASVLIPIVLSCSGNSETYNLQLPVKLMPPTFSNLPSVVPRVSSVPPPPLEDMLEEHDGREFWQKRFMTIQSEFILDGAIDSKGDIYLVGWTDGNLTDGEVPGLMDAFLRKIDSEGKSVWIRQFGSKKSDDAAAITIDHDDNVIVVGKSRGDVVNFGHQGGWDAFIYKFDIDGNELFRTQFGLSEDQQAKGVANDSLGNIFVVGRAETVLEEGVGYGGWDGFLKKFDPNGIEIWSKYFGGIEDDYIEGLTIDDDDNIFFTGTQRPIHPTPVSSPNGEDSEDLSGVFVTKLNPSGEEFWTTYFGTNLDDEALAIVTDSHGNVYIGGKTEGEFEGFQNQGRSDAFVAKLDSSGSILWARQFGFLGDDYVASLELDLSENLYAAGKPSGPFQNYKGSQPGLHVGDSFIRKFDPHGNTLWIHGYDTGWDDYATQVLVSHDGDVYITGFAVCIDPTIAGGESPGGSDPQPPIGWISSLSP